MSESLVLSSIFIGIIVLIGFIGASFGIARGFVATVSILFGAELALWWGDDLGDRMSDLAGMSSATGRFLGGMALLLVTVVLLGIAGSAVLAWGAPTRWGTFLGVALGAANGALLIAMALRLYYLAYAGKLTSLPLDDSIVTRVLWRNFDWYLFGFAAVASGLLLYTRAVDLATTIPDPVARVAYSRPIPPPVPRAEPRVPRDRLVVGANDPDHAPNGVPSDARTETIDNTVYAPPRGSAPVDRDTTSDRSTLATVRAPETEKPPARTPVRYCPNCGMTLDPTDHFCPDCGYTL